MKDATRFTADSRFWLSLIALTLFIAGASVPTFAQSEMGTILVHSSKPGSEPGPLADPMPLPTDWTVELIIDASGSMNKKIRGSETRIELAKSVFEQVIMRDLPEDLPVALRVFGHKGNCETELVLPRERYPRQKLYRAVHEIRASGQTPLAKSIALARKDLDGVPGPKMVLLVTDGENNCPGNPLDAARSLPDDVHLNIVGYAIGNDQHKKDFEKWAAAGHGRYYDAFHADQLDQAIREAFKIPYKVIDQRNNKVVTTGAVDGGPVSVPAGEYQIRLALEGDVIDHVTVDAGRRTSYSILRTRERLEEFKDRAGEMGGILVHSSKPGSEPGRHADPMPLPTDWTVELIIDASGSMNKKIRGSETRIELAKSVFEQVIMRDLPENLPVALRVFGHKGDCETELVLPRNRYPRRKLYRAVHEIRASGQTPLAQSIALARQDLEGVRGPKMVLLVTDGENNCPGNPLDAARSLPDDVHLNIVGYAIGNDQHKKDFKKWATAGHGRYYDAFHADQLDQAIREAFKIPYKVIDQRNNKVVTTGAVDGRPVLVPPGEYQIRLALEGDVIDHVNVGAGRLTSYSIRRTRESLEEFEDEPTLVAEEAPEPTPGSDGVGSRRCLSEARSSHLFGELGPRGTAALCRNAEMGRPAEPIRCFQQVWDYRDDWGAFHEQIHGEDEQLELAIAACRGSIDADRTTECFLEIANGGIYEEIADEIAGGVPWRRFIRDINDICHG